MDQMVSKHAKKNYQKEIDNIWSFIFWLAPLYLFTQMENSLLKFKYPIYYRYLFSFSDQYVVCLHNQLFVYNFQILCVSILPMEKPMEICVDHFVSQIALFLKIVRLFM